ncbi:MAG: hypothetical protein LBC07_05400 [Elusimicrobiota bacterium]|jgi:hypothetical protein|nr:hypothetical protein [Elusimicrobiota bacterium]
MNLRKKFLGICSLAVLVFLSACGGGANKYYGQLRTDLEENRFSKAVELVESSQEKIYGEKNILLFNLDAGLTNHYFQNYAISKTFFDVAKKTFDDFYTKSVSAGALSVVANDLVLPYYGKSYERAHIYVFNALNYILEGDANGAAVEARQADAYLKTLYRDFYKDDGFVRYFSGLVFENAGYINDAYTEYGLALAAYRNSISGVAAPQDLIDSYYTTALALRLDSVARDIKSKYPSAKSNAIPAGQGEVIIVDYNGLSPKKVEEIITLTVGEANTYVSATTVGSAQAKKDQTANDVAASLLMNDYIKLAFPAYQRIPHSVAAFWVETGQGDPIRSYVAQDIATIAEKTLADEIGKIRAKTIASAAIKYTAGMVAAQAVEEKEGKLAGMAAKKALTIAMAALAVADTRTWTTLPSDILMSRFFLPVGKHTITVSFVNENSNVVRRQTITVEVTEGKKTFVVVETLR